MTETRQSERSESAACFLLRVFPSARRHFHLSSGRLCVSPQCPSETYDALHKSTRDFPDEVVSFMRQHQLMWEPVLPVGRRPILTRVGADSMLRRVVVDRVDAEDGAYDVLHLGTGEGAEREGAAVNTPQNYRHTQQQVTERQASFVSNCSASPERSSEAGRTS